MKILTLCAAFMLLSGCAMKAPELQVVPVYTPVPTVIKLPVLERPQLAIHTLTDEQQQQDGEVVKAVIASMIQLINYAQSLEKIIESVNNMDQSEEPDNGRHIRTLFAP